MLQTFCRDSGWINANQQKPSIATGSKLSKNDDGPPMNSTIYKRMVGSLMYLTATRPGLMYDVSLISKFTESKILTGKLENKF